MSDTPYQLPEPSLRWENGQPVSATFDDVYFSRDSGLAEVEHVFVAGNDLETRFRALPADQPGVFCIGETGFGTGLNLLVTWRLWQRSAPPGWRLHWLSTELYPLHKPQLRQALSAWPQLAAEAEALLSVYPQRVPGYHWRWLAPGKVSLGLWYGDAAEGLAALLDSPAPDLAATGPRVDSWVLDGFAPSRNPGMWNDDLYRQLRAWSRPGTRFATFTAAGHVRRGLRDQGFQVEKSPGYGRKRDMLRGVFTGLDDIENPLPAPPAAKPVDYWAAPLVRPTKDRTAVVIGAGLAGSSTALALARRGWQVHVVERAGRIAAGASGNAQGVLYTRFSARPDPLSQFALSSYLHALDHYRQLAATDALPAGSHDFCGVLQLPADPRQARRQQAAAEALTGHPELVRLLDRTEAEQRAGIALPSGGLWLPDAGWLSPAAVCQAQLQHPAIQVRLSTEIIGMQRHDDRWLLQTADGGELDCSLAVVCSGVDSDWLAPWVKLPIRPIRGQVSHIDASQSPHCVLCHEGYVSAAAEGGLWIGATFDPDDRDPELRPADHRRNLDSLAAAIPSLLDADTIADGGRVGFRAASPDYLPLVGPAPAQPDFDRTYAPLSDNARRPVALPPPLLPGLLLNLGHGSRGLTSTPLCAELIAALASGDPRPVDRALLQTITPVRFAARALCRAAK